MGDCIVRLNQLIDQLSPAEARVARYLLDHCQEAIGQPIETVSEACQTSKTTVVRLCKQLGFKGYKALSIALSMELASGGENRISYQDINPGDNIHTIIERVSQHTQAAIADTVRVLREEDVLRAVDALDKAKRVDFYAPPRWSRSMRSRNSSAFAVIPRPAPTRMFRWSSPAAWSGEMPRFSFPIPAKPKICWIRLLLPKEAAP